MANKNYIQGIESIGDDFSIRKAAWEDVRKASPGIYGVENTVNTGNADYLATIGLDTISSASPAPLKLNLPSIETKDGLEPENNKKTKSETAKADENPSEGFFSSIAESTRNLWRYLLSMVSPSAASDESKPDTAIEPMGTGGTGIPLLDQPSEIDMQMLNQLVKEMSIMVKQGNDVQDWNQELGEEYRHLDLVTRLLAKSLGDQKKIRDEAILFTKDELLNTQKQSKQLRKQKIDVEKTDSEIKATHRFWSRVSFFAGAGGVVCMVALAATSIFATMATGGTLPLGAAAAWKVTLLTGEFVCMGTKGVSDLFKVNLTIKLDTIKSDLEGFKHTASHHTLQLSMQKEDIKNFYQSGNQVQSIIKQLIHNMYTATPW